MAAEMLRDLGDMQGDSRRHATARSNTLDAPPSPARPPRREVLRAQGTLLRRVGRVQESRGRPRRRPSRLPARRPRDSLEARARTPWSSQCSSSAASRYAIAIGLEAIRIDLATAGASDRAHLAT